MVETMTLQTAWYMVYGFGLVVIFLYISIFIQRAINLRNEKKQGIARDYLFQKYFDLEDVEMPFTNRFFLDAFIDIESQVDIEKDVRNRIISDLWSTQFIKKQIKNLKAKRLIKRRIAVFYISSLGHDEAICLLESMLGNEKDETIRFMLLYALKDELNQQIVDYTIASIEHSTAEYKRWVYAISKNYYFKLKPFIQTYFTDVRPFIISFILHLSTHTPDLELKAYAKHIFSSDSTDVNLKRMAFAALAKMHPEEVTKDEYCKNDDEEIKKIAMQAAGNLPNQKIVEHLLSSVDGSSLDAIRVQSLSRIIYDSKNMLIFILDYYTKAKDIHQKRVISRVLSHRMDYLMLKIKDASYPYITEIIDLLFKQHIIEDFIDFANHNKDQAIEKELVMIIKKNVGNDPYLLNEFSIYLNQNLLTQIGIIKKPKPFIAKEKAPFEKRKVTWIIMWIVFSILILPMIFVTTNIMTLIDNPSVFFEFMIVSINRYLVIYFMTVNSIYALLLILSIRGSKDRVSHWRMKRKTLLYEADLLPSISIIAPAYNEEKSIIESITSLLNLKYPKYEVIVVNDGSKDQTIDVLIAHFKLERKHPFFKQPLPTKDLRGVYVNRHIPNLIVIDKQNGGKADALNMGINVAKGDYVCGIDADSLLEEEALLKLMSITLDDPIEHIAIGGNIIPVNDCIVDKGKVELNRLGKKPLVRFQTLEYLRAFTTGRIGWAKLRSLLIISGAFGLFNRKTLLETGGYLTISGALKKDTVGEDMELVVRLTYQSLTQKRKYRVEYVHHANCYTELPSDFRSLLKQRNRWQRGLLDILSYHRKILFNPKFKQPGMIAFPYFFIFEMMGPFIEMMGYLALIIGLILGILNLPIVLVLLAATIGYGMALSLFSLFVAEKQKSYYSTKETFILSMVAILENFGYRQIMSLHRITSTFSALKESGNWGTQVRKGFTQK
ncbi:MAG: glycosyltransferase [Acholeplasmataceae bacterium]|jgi:cellulose synthase/poly-beta-1,6-N-acetylglucosamine synthase-like glycosyltransferase|nr:glycosyltransferase [Acholeplasmataceae bacterium]